MCLKYLYNRLTRKTHAAQTNDHHAHTSGIELQTWHCSSVINQYSTTETRHSSPGTGESSTAETRHGSAETGICSRDTSRSTPESGYESPASTSKPQKQKLINLLDMLNKAKEDIRASKGLRKRKKPNASSQTAENKVQETNKTSCSSSSRTSSVAKATETDSSITMTPDESVSPDMEELVELSFWLDLEAHHQQIAFWKARRRKERTEKRNKILAKQGLILSE